MHHSPVKLINIGFFYKGRGFFFSAEPKLTKNGYAFIIPPILYKQTDIVSKKQSIIHASTYYTSKEKKGNHVECIANEAFPLFQCSIWKYYPKNLVQQSLEYLKDIANLIPVNLDEDIRELIIEQNKILYVPDHSLPERNYFPFHATITLDDVPFYELNKWKERIKGFDNQVCIPLAETSLQANELVSNVHTILELQEESVIVSPLDIEDSLQLLPVCKYLSMEHNFSSAIQGRALPFSILYISESIIILGQIDNKMFLEKGSEYALSLFIPLEIGNREVFLTVFVSKLYENKSGSCCAVCRFTSIKEEDRRFLFEKLYGSRYS